MRSRDGAERARVRPPQLLASRRRGQRDPVNGARGELTAGRGHDVHIMSEPRQPFSDRGDVDRSASRAGYSSDLRRRRGSSCYAADRETRGRVAAHSLTSSAKNGPERIRPNRSRSSFITDDSTRSASVRGAAAGDPRLGRRPRFADRPGIDLLGPDRAVRGALRRVAPSPAPRPAS